MDCLNNERIIEIMQKSLNHVDGRLVDHGKRVAYMVFKTLYADGGYSLQELRNICMVAMLHDIGAYKTEEIDKMLIFETTNVWAHSIYGYLFLKHFSPLKELAPAVLYHHANCKEIKELTPSIRELAQLFFICDRADMFAISGADAADFHRHLLNKRDILFDAGAVERFMKASIDLGALDADMAADKTFHSILCETPFTEAEIRNYVDMVIFSIDFRSSQTVIHSVAVASVSRLIAELRGEDEEAIQRITLAAMLHDIGKIGTPTSILESTGRLSDADMAIMKTHINVTEEILRGNIDEDILRMAVNHHEKLNGTGYPRGLREEDITDYERMISVADILSALCYARNYKEAYPKEKVMGIMSDMSEKGLIDPGIVALALTHYDDILDKTNKASQPVIDAYNTLKKEYDEIRETLRAQRRV